MKRTLHVMLAALMVLFFSCNDNRLENDEKKLSAEILLQEKEEAFAELISIFTLIAILISCLGLFGLLAYLIERRSREIGTARSLAQKISRSGYLQSPD